MTPFTAILADPPWAYDQPLRMADGVKRASKDQYPTMTVQGICDLYTPSRVSRTAVTYAPALLAGHPIADAALLGLWITPPFLLDGIHMLVCNAWGFTPKQIVPWIKGRLTVEYGWRNHPRQQVGERMYVQSTDQVAIPKLVIQPGMGALTRGCVEYLVLATRGKYTQLVKSHSINGLLLAEEDAFIIAPKSTHSRKPKEAYAMLERLFPGPYLELFARERREGWDAWGNELPAVEIIQPAPEPAGVWLPDGPIFLTREGVQQLQPDNTVATISKAPKRPKRRSAPADVEIIEWP